MQKTLLLVGVFFIFSCSHSDDLDGLNTISDTENMLITENEENQNQSFRDKESILNYFELLIDGKKIIVGQQCGNTPTETADMYEKHVESLAIETGKYVGLMGADFGWSSEDDYPVETLIDHWNNGGLVTASWHADNPFVDGVDVYWDMVNDQEKIDLTALLKGAEQTVEWTNYRNDLDRTARALQKLQSAGVTVIWRPFHEMNGNFFWWGANSNDNTQTNESDFIAFWIDLYETLRWDYGLENLIWVYSVVPSETWYAEVTAFYPGDTYVDVVGMDYYGKQPDFPHYDALHSLGKPLVISESGPKDGGEGNWDMLEWANLLKGKAAYFLQWHNWNNNKVAIGDNENTFELMNDVDVITRDELMSIAL